MNNFFNITVHTSGKDVELIKTTMKSKAFKDAKEPWLYLEEKTLGWIRIGDVVPTIDVAIVGEEVFVRYY
jgi:hypothetical protein